MTFIIGTGPTEVHALIDLENRIDAHRDARAALAVTVLDVACDHGSWSAIANVRHDLPREGSQ